MAATLTPFATLLADRPYLTENLQESLDEAGFYRTSGATDAEVRAAVIREWAAGGIDVSAEVAALSVQAKSDGSSVTVAVFEVLDGVAVQVF